jgi:Mg/Co/Ni transporter MgtE
VDEEKVDLALAFLQSQPDAAAAILEQQPLEQVAEFLSGVPHTYGALVLEKMLPQYTARLCRHLKPTIAAGMLSAMDISLIAAVIRHCRNDQCRELLDLLPDNTRLATRLLLNYSEDAVGAWMHANVSTLPDDCSVDDAINRIREEQLAVDIGVSLVVNRSRNLQGRVTLNALLRAPGKAPLTAAMVKDSRSISARTALKSAQDNPLWSEQDSVVVTNRKHQLVGVLRHVDLRKGLEQISTSIVQPRRVDAFSGFFEAYASSLMVLLAALGDIAIGKSGRGR